MLRSFNSLAFRQLKTRPLRAVLTTFGIVLGVGMVFGVLLLTATIRSTFDEVFDSAWGETDLIVMGEGAGIMPQRRLESISDLDGVRDAAGMVGGVFTRLDDQGEPLEGNDGRMLIAGYEPGGYQPYDFRLVEGRQMDAGAEVIVEQNWARDRGFEIGDTIPVAGPTGRRRLPVVGIFRLTSTLDVGGLGYAAMPLDAARRVFDLPRGWMQISVAAEDREDIEGLKRQVEVISGPGVRVQTPKELSDDVMDQLSGLNIVLYFFSGVALFVGGFLILNSFNMTVLQRLRELGMLRTLGASRRMATASILTEALVLGLIGTALGLAVGLFLASGLTALMRGLDLPVGSVRVDAGSVIVATIVGVLVTLAGAFWPASRAGRISPIRAVLGQGKVQRSLPIRRLIFGLLLFLPGVIFGGEFWFGEESTSGGWTAYAGIALTMAMFAGMACAAPFIILPVVRWLAVPIRRLFPTGGRLAADSLLSNPLRTAATAVALTIGLSVVVVNSSMSASFTGSLEDQIDRSFGQDFNVQAQGYTLEQGGGPGVPRSAAAAIERMPEAETVAPTRVTLLDLPGLDDGSGEGLAVGIDPASQPAVDGTSFVGVEPAAAYAGLAAGGVVIGQPYAERAGLDQGDTIELAGPAATRSARVVAIVDGVGPMGGMEMRMSLQTMTAVYGDWQPATLAVQARDGETGALEASISRLLDRRYPNLELQSAAEAKQDASDQINQQFNMFNAIVIIAIIVSLLGVINTLAMSVLERTREIGVLRALGATRWQVRLTMLDESLMITAAGALVGVAAGALIGAMWLRGMTSLMPGIRFHFPTGIALTIAVAAVLLGVLAALLPARRAARLDVIKALTYD